MAIPWFVLQTTDSATRTGLTGGAFLLAAVVVAGIFGGPLVDRMGFKRASIVADLTGAVAVALIPLLYHTVGLYSGSSWSWSSWVVSWTRPGTRPARASYPTSPEGRG